MAKEYNKYEHTHVTFNIPGKAQGECSWDGTFEIVLFTGKFVWVSGSYAHHIYPGIEQVGDGRSNGYDVDGNCVLSVPVELVHGYWTAEEAEHIERALEADDRLLNYAR